MPFIEHPVVGRVEFTPLSGGRIALGNWPITHIKTVLVPQLQGVPTYGGAKFSGRVPFFGSAIPQLLAAWNAVEEAGLLHRVIFWGGSFVPRMKRGSRTSPSEHTFGCAFDINPAENPFRRPAAQKGEKGYLLDLCPIFEHFGFECGANWRPENRDAMHFQIKRLLRGAMPVEVPELAPSRGAAPEEKPLLVWNGVVYPVLFDANGRPYPQLATLIEAMHHEVIATTNDLEKEPPRFYVNSRTVQR